MGLDLGLEDASVRLSVLQEEFLDLMPPPSALLSRFERRSSAACVAAASPLQSVDPCWPLAVPKSAERSLWPVYCRRVAAAYRRRLEPQQAVTENSRYETDSVWRYYCAHVAPVLVPFAATPLFLLGRWLSRSNDVYVRWEESDILSAALCTRRLSSEERRAPHGLRISDVLRHVVSEFGDECALELDLDGPNASVKWAPSLDATSYLSVCMSLGDGSSTAAEDDDRRLWKCEGDAKVAQVAWRAVPEHHGITLQVLERRLGAIAAAEDGRHNDHLGCVAPLHAVMQCHPHLFRVDTESISSDAVVYRQKESPERSGGHHDDAGRMPEGLSSYVWRHCQALQKAPSRNNIVDSVLCLDSLVDGAHDATARMDRTVCSTCYKADKIGTFCRQLRRYEQGRHRRSTRARRTCCSLKHKETKKKTTRSAPG